ncbi:MAG: HlyC/CorC family transporter [Chlamydiales bacterium]|nr:HlyC/CorC family transporter [Chlamydiales bacterium]
MITASLVAFLVLLLFLSGYFSSSETALFSLPSMTVKAYQRESDPRKRLIYNLLSRPRDLLVTILMLNILMNLLVQNVVATIFGSYSNWILNVGLPLLLTLVFGEAIPKSIGLANNEKIAYTVAPSLSRAQTVIKPFAGVFISITSVISRIMFFFLRKEDEISIDELQHALKTSREYGVLNEDEAELIRGYLNLQESSIKALMRPREEVLFFDLEEPLSKLIHLFVDQECSRIPICRGGLDQIVGVMTSRLFFLHRPSLNQTLDLLPILMKPIFVPETMPAHALLRQMYEQELSIATVVDEYGSVSGIIALEDLVEVVVGEIVDRRDEKNRYTKAGEEVIITSGKLELIEFEEIFGVSLKSENNMVTIGGWLTEQLGDIPKAGTKFLTKEFLFHVLAADPQRIRRVYIRRLHTKKKRS